MADSASNETTSGKARPGADHAMNYILFIMFLLVSGGIIAFFTYKLVSSLRQKQKAKEEKKKQKLQKKEKETQRKQKKK